MVEAQVDMLFDEEELNIANELLGSLDHLGYLGIDLSDLAKELKVNEEYVDQVRKETDERSRAIWTRFSKPTRI